MIHASSDHLLESTKQIESVSTAISKKQRVQIFSVIEHLNFSEAIKSIESTNHNLDNSFIELIYHSIENNLSFKLPGNSKIFNLKFFTFNNSNT